MTTKWLQQLLPSHSNTTVFKAGREGGKWGFIFTCLSPIEEKHVFKTPQCISPSVTLARTWSHAHWLERWLPRQNGGAVIGWGQLCLTLWSWAHCCPNRISQKVRLTVELVSNPWPQQTWAENNRRSLWAAVSTSSLKGMGLGWLLFVKHKFFHLWPHSFGAQMKPPPQGWQKLHAGFWTNIVIIKL